MIIINLNTPANIRINPAIQPYEKGNILHIQKQRCHSCTRMMGGIAIDLDYVENGEKLLDSIVQVLDNYKCKSVCQSCLTANLKNPITGGDVRDLK